MKIKGQKFRFEHNVFSVPFGHPGEKNPRRQVRDLSH